MIYSLPSLNRENPADVEGILANLTLGMLPNPGISHESGIPSDLRDRLIHEIRIRLGLKRDDNSPKAMSRIYELLAQEIGRAALADVDIKEVKTRLGDRGELAPPLYKIQFMDSFKDSERRGVAEREVEATLQSPDSVEHLHPELLGIASKRATSLYLKRFNNNRNPLNSYSLLGFCTRVGYVQQVGEAWRIFHSDVDLSKAKTPLDVLKSLVSKYGFEIQVGESRGAFFWHERVPILPNTRSEFLKIPKLPNTDFSVTWSPGPVVDNTLEITYAFGINNTAYEVDLAKHGIRTKPIKTQNPIRS
jgi:hypothetical protein